MARKTSVRRVAIQGERGAFSEEAARQLVGPEVAIVPFQRFDEAFRSLSESGVDLAVIPIENTLHGSVHENYDHLLTHPVEIVGETSVRIVHNLIALPGVQFRNVKQVYSHPVALNQCLRFFEKNPRLERVPFYDTAGSVKMLAEEGRRDAAAIASSVSASIYGARILKRSIEDDRQNFTRFFLLRRKGGDRQGVRPRRSKIEYKTTVVFKTRNMPGSLFRCLSVFALRDLNLTKIESRPLRGKPWEYLFYLDFLGHVEDSASHRALSHLDELSDSWLVLGCYPRGA